MGVMQNTRLAALDHRRTRTLAVVAAALAAAFIFARPAAADPPASDPSANGLVKLFIDACVPNIGAPDKVRAWADQQHFPPITRPEPLAVFVGKGNKGSAWMVPSALGDFALSIRGLTQACAVWARRADPDQVKLLFKKLIDGVKRPGIEIRVRADKTDPSPVGAARTLVYTVRSSFVFTMLTAERPGGAFQASLQVAEATGTR